MHPAGMGLSCGTSQPILEPFLALGCKGEPPAPSSILGTGRERGAVERARSCGTGLGRLWAAPRPRGKRQ